MPGVPGAGLSGLFYVLSAVVAIVLELVATMRGRSSMARWRAVVRHASLAAGIVLSITVVYSGAKLLFSDAQPQSELVAGGVAVETTTQPADAASLELLPIAPVLMSIGALGLLLGITLLLGLGARSAGARDRRAVVVPASAPDEDRSAVDSSPTLTAWRRLAEADDWARTQAVQHRSGVRRRQDFLTLGFGT